MRRPTSVFLLAALGAVIVFQTAARAADVASIKTAVQRSAESLRSGYGYFVRAYVPSPYTEKITREEVAANESKGVRKLLPDDMRSVDRFYWAFDGPKWRFDRNRMFPKSGCGSLAQVAWDGSRGTGLTCDGGFVSNDMSATRLYALIGMMDAFFGYERKWIINGSFAYAGDEELDGITTHHLVVRQQSVTRDIWVSPSHGYLTKRMRSTPDPGKGILSIYDVQSFRQYGDTWFPEVATEIDYPERDGQRQGADITRYRTLEFHANVDIPEWVFSVRFPVGMTIYGPEPGKESQIGGTVTKEELEAFLKPAAVDTR